MKCFQIALFNVTLKPIVKEKRTQKKYLHPVSQKLKYASKIENIIEKQEISEKDKVGCIEKNHDEMLGKKVSIQKTVEFILLNVHQFHHIVHQYYHSTHMEHM